MSEKGERLEITGLLAAIRQGDATAMDRLLSLVYDDLKRRARRQLGWRRDATLSTTGLVHEAYLRLAATPPPTGRTATTSSRWPRKPCAAWWSTTRAGAPRSSGAGSPARWG